MDTSGRDPGTAQSDMSPVLHRRGDRSSGGAVPSAAHPTDQPAGAVTPDAADTNRQGTDAIGTDAIHTDALETDALGTDVTGALRPTIATETGPTSGPTDLTPMSVIESGSVDGAGSTSLVPAIALYSVLRLGLVVVLTAVLVPFMPLIVALLFAIIVQLPLSWLLFSGPRRRVNEAIASASQHRRAERARLQAALSGDDVIE